MSEIPAKIFLIVLGALFLFYGVTFTFWPQALLQIMPYESLSPEAVTEVRAAYGGIELFVGLYFLYAALYKQRWKEGLISAFLLCLFILFARTFGMIVDGASGRYTINLLVLEALFFVISVAVLIAGTRLSQPR